MANLRELRARRQAERTKPTLAELRARKQEQKDQNGTLAALRKRKRMQKEKQAKKSSKQDFVQGGIRYHNAQQVDGYWTIDVSNGDLTYTLHNRHGAWFHDVYGRDGWMKEPVSVARALGTNIDQLEICQALTRRLEAEFKARGIPTREQRIRMREEEELAKRRKKRKKDDNTDE